MVGLSGTVYSHPEFEELREDLQEARTERDNANADKEALKSQIEELLKENQKLRKMRNIDLYSSLSEPKQVSQSPIKIVSAPVEEDATRATGKRDRDDGSDDESGGPQKKSNNKV